MYNKQKDRESPMGKIKTFFFGEMDGRNVFTNAKN
jgi:cellobiose-specific phosphotransferase system component IIB